jgi:hypothetical protein
VIVHDHSSTAYVTGAVNESIYSNDAGSNFRINSCEYRYNLSANSIGIGTYRVAIIINTQIVGSTSFALR